MRIVSGIHKGKKIYAPKRLPVRPTTDFAKEALFNILHNRYHWSGLTVIDLFSGTGNISYEFGSRGAARITAVDAHPGCVSFIAKTAEELDLPIETVKSDVLKFLLHTPLQADVIFADPPYEFSKEAMAELAKTCFERRLIREDGCLILEHSKKLDLSDQTFFQEQRKYGNSVFSIFVP